MDSKLASALSVGERSALIMPAGCGKTELIAKAVSISADNEKRQLILTHTNAGVKSIYDRLRRFQVPQRKFYIDTIDSFALRYSASFPESSGLGKDFDPLSNEWDKVLNSASLIFTNKCVKQVINASYCGLYVDEYQDCSLIQHKIILELASILPTRIVGDPLQGIFDFGDNKIVNWYIDVFPNFERVCKDYEFIPYRWVGRNERLGNWLKKIRESLIHGNQISLNDLPDGVKWLQNSPFNQISACKAHLFSQQTSVAILHFPNNAHNLAHKLGGSYLSMDAVESKDVSKWLSKIENSQGIERVIALIDLSSACFIGASTTFQPIRKMFTSGKYTITKKNGLFPLFIELCEVSNASDWHHVLSSMQMIKSLPKIKLFRSDLWSGTFQVIREVVNSETDMSFSRIALDLRLRNKAFDRKLAKHLVSTTLLIKGLEFDHAIIADADALNSKELYVAMTRGTRTLTILSNSSLLKKTVPLELIPPKK